MLTIILSEFDCVLERDNKQTRPFIMWVGEGWIDRQPFPGAKRKVVNRSQARNGRLCRVAVADLGELAPAITIRGGGLLG